MTEIRTLKNGVKIIMEDLPYLQSVAVGLWFKTGSADETDDISGISHFIEHMMFKGTENRTAKDIAGDIDKIGGQFNAFTSKEYTCYYVKTISDNYKKAADVLVDMMTNSLFDDEEMNRERKVILEEIKMSNDSPDDYAHDKAMELVFKGTPYSKPIIGTPESLADMDSKAIKKYIKEQYTRDSLVISVAGNFDKEDVCRYFENKFTSLTESKAKRITQKEPYKPAYQVLVKDIEQSHIFLINRNINVEDKRYYPLSIVNNALGGSMSSRLFQNIRERKGLAYSVFSAFSSMSDDGYFMMYAGVSHDKIADAINGIKEELQILARDGITQEELDSSKEQIKSAYAFEQENVNARMMKNGKNLTLYGHVFDQNQVLKDYDAVTLESCREAAKLICDIDTYTAVVCTNKDFDLEAIVRK